MIKFLLLLTSMLFYSNLSLAESGNDICLGMIEEIDSSFNNIKAVPASLDKQVIIDKEAQGANRFTVEENVLLVEAERLPTIKEKVLLSYYRCY